MLEAMGAICDYLAKDHRRLEDALRRATAHDHEIEHEAYLEFRGGLLRHIAMEEKTLLPSARKVRDGAPIPIAEKLRLDHGALAALLVLTPTRSVVAAIRQILERHNKLEEGTEGVYVQCEQLL